jgi:hypothetical protein
MEVTKDGAVKDNRKIWQWTIELSYADVAKPRQGKWVVQHGDTV